MESSHDDKDVSGQWEVDSDNVQGFTCEIPVCVGSRSTSHEVWSMSRCPRKEHWRCGSTSRCPFLPLPSALTHTVTLSGPGWREKALP